MFENKASQLVVVLIGDMFYSGYISQAAKLGTEGMPLCRLFSLEELMEATKNFDKSNLLGEGSYGKVISKTRNVLQSIFT